MKSLKELLEKLEKDWEPTQRFLRELDIKKYCKLMDEPESKRDMLILEILKGKIKDYEKIDEYVKEYNITYTEFAERLFARK